MAIYKYNDGKIIHLPRTYFSIEGIGEFKDLQSSLIKDIEILEKGLFVLCNEFGDWEDSKRRIDILCLDKDANLVVIELKTTENGGHMELQSIRYAAMVANMTFDKAVKAYENYLIKNQIEIVDSPKDQILRFLEWEDANEDHFANDVRIILVSADFSKEITTTVLWLQNRDIDIKCVRIKPQKDGNNIYLDIQQIIPLPEAADYQIKLKEKAVEQRQARRDNTKDYSKYNVTIKGESAYRLNKRQTMYFVIRKCINSGITPEQLMRVTSESRWLSVDKLCQSGEEFGQEYREKGKRRYDPNRWFSDDNELIRTNDRTYVFSNQYGTATYGLVLNIFENFPELDGKINKCEESE